MRLILNIGSTYFSHLTASAIGILMVPVHFRLLGAESYGLVGFHAVIQAAIQILDLGLSAAIANGLTRTLVGEYHVKNFKRFFKYVVAIFLVTTSLFLILGAFFSPVIVDQWLRLQSLPAEQATIAVRFMIASIAIRWLAVPFRAVFIGAEQLAWLAVFNLFVTCTRFVGVLVPLIVYDASAVCFFAFQMAVSIIEVLALSIGATKLLRIKMSPQTGANAKPIREQLLFAGAASISTIVWTAATQADKLIVSSRVPLAEYGIFTLAVTASTIIVFLASPLTLSILPRLTSLRAQGDVDAATDLYRWTTRYVSIVVAAVAMTMAFYSKSFLWAWTDDPAVASHAAAVLTASVLGAAMNTMAGLVYLIQYAHGNLRMHALGGGIFLSAIVPSVAIACEHGGVVGAAVAGAMINGLYLLFWTPLIHRRFLNSLHLPWLFRDVLPPFVIAAAICGGASLWKAELGPGRLLVATQMVALAVVCIGATLMIDGAVRRKLVRVILLLLTAKNIGPPTTANRTQRASSK